ncbi:signal peptidase I [Candidatus Roizmanbacteria bacterium RIFCSPLOWO2_01_FULL_38_11]|uniref:Signal peptidase I n=1 Tax=Candidatus Roizmanbacteria bacterium RIFCSPLOWO2_01_FULL_38_11 TaxID=1802060 RepID=A0A1F7INR7_9BACT|nr:MAG: signal peptidase I [Candidatus Roizmanbacteria bacterium RIFCSPLOWO2_01_FULL_38_11]
MTPSITPNDLTVVRELYMNHYAVGDIISFYNFSEGKETIVTHRIDSLGGNVYVTKGDANDAVDRQIVRPRLIIGKVIMIIPKIGAYIKFLKSNLGTMMLIILPAVFIITTELRKMKRNMKVLHHIHK